MMEFSLQVYASATLSAILVNFYYSLLNYKNMEYAFVYFILALNSLNVIAIITLFFYALSYFFHWLIHKLDAPMDFERREHKDTFTPKYKKYLWVFILSAVWAFFVPTGNNLLLIITGGKAIEYIKNSDKAQDLPDVVLDYLTKELKK